MKKIKGLLLFGILTLLGIGSSYATTGFNSTFSFISSDGQTYSLISKGSSRAYLDYAGFDWFSSGSKFITDNSIISPSSTGFYRDFYSPNGLNLFYYTGSQSFYNYGINNSLYYSWQSDYLNYDGFPLIYDSVGNYLTFSSDNEIIYNGSSKLISNVNYLYYCFYGNGFNLSCLFSTDSLENGFKFKSFGIDNGNIIEYSDIAIIPLHTSYSNTGVFYFSGYNTLVLSYGNYNNMQNLGIIYNLYNCYTSNYSELQNCNLNSKGYINIDSSSFFHRNFLSILGASSNSSKLLGSFAEIFYNGGHFYFRNNSSLFTYGSESTSTSNIPKNCYSFNNCYMQGELDLISDDSVEELINREVVPSQNSVASSSLYLNCLGPLYNTSDGLPPAYCFNGSGELDPLMYSNCFDSIDSEYNVHNYCYIDGVLQEINVVPYGSGFVPVACGDNCFNSNILDVLNSYATGYTVDYFENYLNTTGFFFKCPWPYDNKLTLWPKLITLLNGVDILLPINCGIAGFSYGKNILTFENSGHFVSNGPLLNFEGDNRSLLYYFFDIIISIGIVIFAGKIFYLYHK